MKTGGDRYVVEVKMVCLFGCIENMFYLFFAVRLFFFKRGLEGFKWALWVEVCLWVLGS